jgi:hypothetical protein
MECRVRASLPKNISLYKAMGYSVSKEEVVVRCHFYWQCFLLF